MESFEDQINIIRKEKHLAYVKYIDEVEEKEVELNKLNQEKEFIAIKNKYMYMMANKYKYLFNPSKEDRAATIIQRFIRRKWFGPLCINNDEISKIPPLYRIRIYITSYNIKEYMEENIDSTVVNAYRHIYNMNREDESKIVLFRYCFDIRELYHRRNRIVELYENFYFLQPYDHERIVSCWRKVNGETIESTNYLTNFEFTKSLVYDQNKERIENEKSINTDIPMDIDNIIDDDFLDELNRKYIDNFLEV